MIKLAPSILAADPLNLERDARYVESAKCDWLHVDVMDAHFVPNLAYSADVVRRLKQVVSMPVDVHLMMDHPETMLDRFLESGADIVTIHAEIGSGIREMLKRIRESGALAGIALKPDTPAEIIDAYRDEADLILAMTVEPGFGGQPLDERVPAKIRKIRASGYSGLIEADGGIREDNLQMLMDCGLDVAVMGTALFHDRNLPEAVCRMHGFRRRTAKHE